MKRNKGALFIAVLAFVVVMGIAVKGYPQQQPPVQLKAQTAIAPAQISAKLSVHPASYLGKCPALITFKGTITSSKSATVKYKFIRSDNAVVPEQTIVFEKPGTQEVSTTWQPGDDKTLATYSGWQAIQIISPVNVQSNKAAFRIRCAAENRPEPAGQGSQDGAATHPPQGLPDLVIEDITLNEQCFVVVKAKNKGPGSVPDGVWTAHTPDSSSVYLYINGKTWGGETIWHFDAAKGLQIPGGTAMMTSNLKVTGTATIKATIDHTGKVKEANEANNQMTKKLTCQAGGTTQPTAQEDCVPFNPATTTAQEVQGSWKVVDGTHWMFDFGPKKDDANKALAIIKQYKMNKSCFVGRPNASFHYMLIGNASPAGAFSGEDCLNFNPATTTVQQVQGSWKVVDGTHWMFDFGTKKDEADQTLVIIKKYGFTYSCFVGRPGPNFTYMRK